MPHKDYLLCCAHMYIHTGSHLVRLAFVALDVLLQVVLHTEGLGAANVGAPVTHTVNNTQSTTQSAGTIHQTPNTNTAQHEYTAHREGCYACLNASHATGNATYTGPKQILYTSS